MLSASTLASLASLAPRAPLAAPLAPLPPDAAPAPPTVDAPELGAAQAEPPPPAPTSVALGKAYRDALAESQGTAAALEQAEVAFGRSGADFDWQTVETAQRAHRRASLLVRHASVALDKALASERAATISVKFARFAELKASLSEGAIAARIAPHVAALAAVLEQLAAAIPPMEALVAGVASDTAEALAIARELRAMDRYVSLDRDHEQRVLSAGDFMRGLLGRRLFKHAQERGFPPGNHRYLFCEPPPVSTPLQGDPPAWLVEG